MGIKGKGRLLTMLAVALVLTLLFLPKQNASALSVEDLLTDEECVSWTADLAHPLQITPQAPENGRLPLTIRFSGGYSAGDQVVAISSDATGHVAGIGMITPEAAAQGASSEGLQLSLPGGALTRVYLLDGDFAPTAPGVELWS